MMAQVRINQEKQNIMRNPPGQCSAGPAGSDIFNWNGMIIGPRNTPYFGGVFRLRIQFPPNYPAAPPMVQFITPIYHPNIHSNGNICLDILKGQKWRPTITISKLLLSICSLLTDPNPDDPLEATIANLYKRDRRQFNQEAANFTRRHAMPR